MWNFVSMACAGIVFAGLIPVALGAATGNGVLFFVSLALYILNTAMLRYSNRKAMNAND